MPWLKSKTWAALALGGLALGGVFGAAGCRGSKPTVQWETAAVDRGRIVARVTATGTLSALVTVQVGSQVSGRIQQLFVDFNSPVKKGQLIAKIDPQLFQASLEQARANFAAAAGQLSQGQGAGRAGRDRFPAPGEPGRAQAGGAGRLRHRQDQPRGRQGADRGRTEGNLQQAKAALNQAKVNLAYTNIVSPTDGVVISRSVDVGQTVAASLPAPTIFVIAEDLRKMQVDTSVAEADVGKLTAGMEATFVVDAYPGERFKGKVRQIRNAAQTVQNVVTYDAVIDVGQFGPQAAAGHDRQRELRVRQPRGRAARAERRAALPSRAPRSRRRSTWRPSQARAAVAAGRARSGGTGEAFGGQAEAGAAPGGRSWRGRRAAGSQARCGSWRAARRALAAIKVGATDGTKTEVVEGPLAEGDAGHHRRHGDRRPQAAPAWSRRAGATARRRRTAALEVGHGNPAHRGRAHLEDLPDG